MSASTTLLDVVPATLRKVVYALFGTLGVAVGGVQVAYSAAGLGQPVWLTVATSVLVFLGIPVSATALLHVPAAQSSTLAVSAQRGPDTPPVMPVPVVWPPVAAATDPATPAV